MAKRDRRIIDRVDVDGKRGYMVDLSEGDTANPDCYWPMQTVKLAMAFLVLVDGGMDPMRATRIVHNS